MKIIHCADIHLDSKMETNLSKEKAKDRKNELLITFEKMIEYANNNEVKIIIIAGDLFDKSNVSSKAKKTVKNIICSNPSIDFIYLKGNHDEADFFELDEEIPSNLKMFNKNLWVQYEYNDIVISGIEFGEKNKYEIYNSLILDKNKTNIVVLHGQESNVDSDKADELINVNSLRNKNIDYLALGHIHTYKKEKLDNKGFYCYPGCLEGRGFDECGEKGFVLLDIEGKNISSEFIKFSKRTLYEVNVDLTNIMKYNEIEQAINSSLNNISKDDLVKVNLIGENEIDEEKDISYLNKKYEERFYFIKFIDKMKLKIDIEKFKNDISLRGEFINLVYNQTDLLDDEKAKIIQIGIKALIGEEL